MTRALLAACILVLIGPVAAQEEEPPISQEELAGAKTAALELDTMEVTSALSVHQEAALRIVRQALDQPRSLKRADFDKWRCWLDTPTGTRLKHLYCARNGDLWALQPKGEGGRLTAADMNPVRYGGYGEILVSEKPINGDKLRRMLQNIPGTSDNDHTFVNMVLKGEEPPRDVPSDEELDLFAEAYQAVGSLDADGADEDAQIRAIEKNGLTLDRYNRIATLVEEHNYLNAEVAARLSDDSG